MAESNSKFWRADAFRRRFGNVQELRKSLHRNCDEIKYIGVEVATTVVFLYWLIRTVSHELGF